MQKDMHYFGVYALARAAGMRDDAAEIVATASEYVDDAIWDKEVFLEDGRSILAELTAHKLLNLKNADAEDQRKVWLPFHCSRIIWTRYPATAKAIPPGPGGRSVLR